MRTALATLLFLVIYPSTSKAEEPGVTEAPSSLLQYCHVQSSGCGQNREPGAVGPEELSRHRPSVHGLVCDFDNGDFHGFIYDDLDWGELSRTALLSCKEAFAIENEVDMVRSIAV